MSPAEALRVVLRHWLIITFGLVLTVAGTASGFVIIPDSYSSTSVVMLLQRPTKATAGGENPYLSMDASLTVTAAAVQRAVSDSPLTAAALTATDRSGTFLITPVMSGPFLQIDTGATTPTKALAIQQVVREQMRRMLTTLQSSVGAPSNLQIQLNEVTQPTKPVPVLKRKLQFVGAILFGGLAVTVSLAFLADRLRARRRGDDAPQSNLGPGDSAQTDPPGPEPVQQEQAEDSTSSPRQPAPDPRLVLRPNVPRRAPGELAGSAPSRPHVPSPALAPQPRPGNDRIKSTVRPPRSQTRNGVNGFPAAPATPERGWSFPDGDHGTGLGGQRTLEQRPAGRAQAQRDRN